MNQASLDFTTPEHLRDEALQLVSDNAQPWSDQALALLPLLSESRANVTGEDIRVWIGRQIGQPHHHNAWGALINTAIRRGVIEFAGEYRKMRTPTSHARRTPTYRVLA